MRLIPRRQTVFIDDVHSANFNPNARDRAPTPMKLSQGELWLIDWVLCAQGEQANLEKLRHLMGWEDLRARTWRALMLAELDAQPNQPQPPDAAIDLTDDECRTLLALIPTTFRWGIGEDVGITLKQRLAEQLWGEEIIELHKNNDALAAIAASFETPIQEESHARSADDQPEPSEKPSADAAHVTPDAA